MDVNATIALGRIFWRVKEKVVEKYKNLGERMPDDDLISLTLVTLYEQGYTHPTELEDAVLARLRPIDEKERERSAHRAGEQDRSCHQSQDGQGARSTNPANASRSHR